MSEQGEFVLGHACSRLCRETAWESDPSPDLDLVEAMPASDRQKLVVSGRANGAPKARCESQDRFAAGSECGCHPPRRELPGSRVNGQNPKVRLTAERSD